MKNSKATVAEWRRLFDTVIQFKQLSPWKWMGNEDHLVITDPETGEPGYGVVLGAGGQEFGFNLYLGPKAGLYLQELSSIYESPVEGDLAELAFNMKGITVNFQDRLDLEKADYVLIKGLGYSFRGAKAWPRFQSYEPGMMPWTLDGQQVRCLTAAVEQAVYVAGELRDNTMLFSEHDEVPANPGKKRPHRVPTMTTEGVEWHTEWLPWILPGEYLEPYIYPNELQLYQLKKRLASSAEVWESDYSFLPVAVGEHERPVYPRLCLWVDPQNSRILAADIVEIADCRQEYVSSLITLLEKSGRKPAQLTVASTKALLALQSSAAILGIPLQLHPRPEALLHARMALEDSFF